MLQGIEHRLESVQEVRRRPGEKVVAEVHHESDKSGDSHLGSPKRQHLDAAPDETELAKEQPTVHASWSLMEVGLQENA